MTQWNNNNSIRSGGQHGCVERVTVHKIKHGGGRQRDRNREGYQNSNGITHHLSDPITAQNRYSKRVLYSSETSQREYGSSQKQHFDSEVVHSRSSSPGSFQTLAGEGIGHFGEGGHFRLRHRKRQTKLGKEPTPVRGHRKQRTWTLSMNGGTNTNTVNSTHFDPGPL